MTKKSTKGSKETHGRYTLWTKPRITWSNPFDEVEVSDELTDMVEESVRASDEIEERIEPYTTPVTPETMWQPTEG